MTEKIQKVELDCYDSPIFCIFCGKEVIGDPTAKGSEDLLSPCSHTLFITTDDGFEYRSPAFNKDLGLKDDDDIDLGEEDHDYDSFTDMVKIKNSVKLAIFVPPPGGMGVYIGFAPREE